MRLEGQRWRTLVSTVRLGRHEYRVVRPAKPIEHAPMFEGYQGVQIVVDKAAARTLAVAWEFAMRSPRTLVYLPLRRNASECAEDERLLDLVLLHHSLGFPASRWKEVRAGLGRGQPHTVVSRGLPRLNDVRDEQYEAYYREYKDDLRSEFAADTLFLTGSWKAFAAEGDKWRELVEDGPRLMHDDPGAHCCAEITVDKIWDWLHVVYCDEHRV